MKKIFFVTTNPGKIASLKRKLPTNIELEQLAISLPEIQGDSSSDISIEKAKAAFQILKKPLIVQDSSFHVNALKGFPGPYIKYMQETIGVEGLLKLMKGIEDRSCYFEQAVTYIDDTLIKTFKSDKKIGSLALEVDNKSSIKEWGMIWRVYIPQGFSKTLSMMTREGLTSVDPKIGEKSEFTYFLEWLLSGK